MDAYLIPIFGFVIIVVAIIGGVVSGIVSKVLDYKKSQASIGSRTDGAETKALLERTAMVEDRLAVLERIATDRGQLLSEEIEQLRVTAGTNAKTRETIS